MKRLTAATALVGLLFLSACESTNAGSKETAGTLLGAAGGALLGSQVGDGKGQLVGVAVGTLAGAYLGREIGRSLDRADQAAMRQARNRALNAPIGQRIVWSNPDSGNSGSVTPLREGTDTATGSTCREFQNTVTIDSEEHRATGIACRQPDGTWRIAP